VAAPAVVAPAVVAPAVVAPAVVAPAAERTRRLASGTALAAARRRPAPHESRCASHCSAARGSAAAIAELEVLTDQAD